ncbi:MAG: hypothetical protein IPO82_15350 [Betaproteobacteria bacterium]|nr:hypothetical protein [Betaproteobacteria bacterium]
MEKCATCHYYDRRHARGQDGRSSRSGPCRRSAPMLSPVSTKSYQIEGVWPTVRDDDWCGEWKILLRRPAVVPAQQVAVAALALVAAPQADADDDGDRKAMPVPTAESALAMAAD